MSGSESASTSADRLHSESASTSELTGNSSNKLPNTGTADSTVAMVAAAASAALGLGLAGRRRKEDEEA